MYLTKGKSTGVQSSQQSLNIYYININEEISNLLLALFKRHGVYKV